MSQLISAVPVGRGQVIDAIRGGSQTSRVDLVRLLGFSPATISTLVRELIVDGLVEEIGRAPSTGGKPRVLLSLVSNSRYAAGVSLDQSGISYVVADLDGAIIGRLRRPGAGKASPAAVVERIGMELMSLVHRVGVEPSTLLGVGVVSPGPITGGQGMALTPPAMRAWRDYPLADALQEATGLRVLVENDASAAAVGEYWAGPAVSSRCFAALYMGTGIGAGLVVDGRLHRGVSGNTGEIGHNCVDLSGPSCWCGAHGCLEAVAGPRAVVAAAVARGLTVPGVSVFDDFAALARLAIEGNPVAGELFAQSAGAVAVAIQSLCNIMDPDLIVLTGPAFTTAGSLYLPIIQERLDTVFMARDCHRVEVTLSLNAAEAASIGGAALVLQSELVFRPTATPSAATSSGPLKRT